MRHPSGKILVATENPRFFHLASEALKQRGYKIVHAMPSDAGGTLPIITTGSERPRVVDGRARVFCFDDATTPLTREEVSTFADIVSIALNPSVSRQERIVVTIGIDPGEKMTGMCLLVNHALVEATRIPSDLQRVTQFIRKGIQAAFSRGEHPVITIKIGNGEQVKMAQILDHLLSMDENASFDVEIVDEFQSNACHGLASEVPGSFKLGDHERAAMTIASREGVSAKAILEREDRKTFSKKQLKKVQHESREMSNQLHIGISIDKDMAGKVLRGEVTLEDAINRRLARHRGTAIPPP